MAVDRLVEHRLAEGVGLWNYTCVSAPGEEVEMQLVGYYFNFRDITVAPPTSEPTAQPPTTHVPETMSPDGSSGLAKGVVVLIVGVSCLVAVAGAAGVYFYRKKVSERNREGEGRVQGLHLFGYAKCFCQPKLHRVCASACLDKKEGKKKTNRPYLVGQLFKGKKKTRVKYAYATLLT